MKKLNLYLDFEFTSLSPDAQPISIGIVSESFCSPCIDKKLIPDEDCENCSGEWHKGLEQKSFYAEFTDFDINRCDDWVKENVVSKLKYYGTSEQDKMFLDSSVDEGTYWGSQNIAEIKEALYRWVKQFSDYQIQIVVDCGTCDWYWFLQLVAEWDGLPETVSVAYESIPPDMTLEDVVELYKKSPVVFHQKIASTPVREGYKTGLPKLPSNISPAPFDLNDIIAIKKGISPKEAFDLNREVLAFGRPDLAEHEKHNSLFDAKIIKAIYQKLMQ